MTFSRMVTMVLFCVTITAIVSTGGEPANWRTPPWHHGSLYDQYAVPADSQYKSPINLVLTGDGRTLYVVCENTSELLRVDTRRRRVTGSISVGLRPLDITLSPDETRVYVTNRWHNTVSVVDLESFEVVDTLRTGFNPHGVVADSAYLYVGNGSSDNISVIRLSDGSFDGWLMGGREPFDMAISPDGSMIAVTSQLSQKVPFREPPETEITFIDGRKRYVVDHRIAENTVIQQGVTFTPDGKWLLAVCEVPRNLIPETQIYQGWMVTYALIVAEAHPGGRTAYLLLDDMDRYYADPFGVAVSPDGGSVYVSSSGVDVVSVIDWASVQRTLRIENDLIGVSEDTVRLYRRHLGISSEYVRARIATGKNPKSMVISPDGRWLYVAERLNDTIGIIDLARDERVNDIDLGGPEIVSELRYGEYLFNHSEISFQQQLACNTCHPENHVDGLLYDIAIDGGMGRNVVDNRSMRGVALTAPFKWSGKNPSLQRQEGPRAAQLFFRSHGFEPDGVEAITHFIESIPLPPNPYADTNGRLSDAQHRGKALYSRERTNTGAYIPQANRCITCHPAPFYTNRRKNNVGTQLLHDTNRHFDTPQLNRVWESPPYLHDGRCWTLEEIWTQHNPDDLHGQTNDMTKEQLNDLIEYLKTF
jgi:YVTN family beta-propeller protein